MRGGAAVHAYVCTLQHGHVIPARAEREKHSVAGEVHGAGKPEAEGWLCKWSRVLLCLQVMGE